MHQLTRYESISNQTKTIVLYPIHFPFSSLAPLANWSTQYLGNFCHGCQFPNCFGPRPKWLSITLDSNSHTQSSAMPTANREQCECEMFLPPKNIPRMICMPLEMEIRSEPIQNRVSGRRTNWSNQIETIWPSRNVRGNQFNTICMHKYSNSSSNCEESVVQVEDLGSRGSDCQLIAANGAKTVLQQWQIVAIFSRPEVVKDVQLPNYWVTEWMAWMSDGRSLFVLHRWVGHGFHSEASRRRRMLKLRSFYDRNSVNSKLLKHPWVAATIHL